MKIKKYVLVGVVAIAVLAAGGVYYFARYKMPDRTGPAFPRAAERKSHVYKNPEQSIAKMKILAFYAVPRNKTGHLESNWKNQLQAALDDAVKFHALQLKGTSELTYSIFQEPVVLEKDDIFYDTEVTAAGNPRALVNVAEEIGRRVFEDGGDLYRPEFATDDPAEYRVMGIVYEGVGAAGGIIYESPLETPEEIAEEIGVPRETVYIVEIEAIDAFFLVNRREYLAEEKLQLYGSSIFYHEFGHTLGLPDEYDAEDKIFSQDIMGGGRSKPFSRAYISRDFLRGMGVE
ncbi:MAG: hypothetical protein A2945_03510 [Candidatus Liptonbacteria bacterium RIFCSPLOWO2_01_FULL_52_25]|uniref:Uncharacterized protein n=1 Tax=Candidatus Liptonbacteria bacterium RIFCSPLOWO2_01_FULL_52_25 TaxID=1798650 RepID=A0A1G2CGN2_9BACT|nr:MAG: hypothetical protein A2945_03510 [Candidatus Liptonbacteria bacterium RIFCSPLOWO2_01_FULL_52_25]